MKNSTPTLLRTRKYSFAMALAVDRSSSFEIACPSVLFMSLENLGCMRLNTLLYFSCEVGFEGLVYNVQ